VTCDVSNTVPQCLQCAVYNIERDRTVIVTAQFHTGITSLGSRLECRKKENLRRSDSQCTLNT